MSETPLEKSPYSLHFNILRNFGGWILETRNPLIRNAYALFGTLLTVSFFAMCFLMNMNLYLVYGDLKRMAWNLCFNVLFTGCFLKHVCTQHRFDVVNSLRMKLHKNETSGVTPDDLSLNRSSARELKQIETVSYSASVILIPLWLITSYLGSMWGERDIPLPLWIPFQVDYQNEVQFNVLFLAVSTLGIAGVIFVLSVELAMVTIPIQISREYNRLIKDLRKINEFYRVCRPVRGRLKMSALEVNPHLRDIQIRRILKECIFRQRELIGYTNDFEIIYTHPMLLQFFVVSLLFILCTILVITEYDNITWGTAFLMGFSMVTLSDVFVICWFATRLRSQCFSVGEAAYSVLWYRMGTDIQKNIYMIIMRSQRPPKLTSGKIMELDLHAFLTMLRNIYSWLALYKHLDFNINRKQME